jgi:NADPH-dependent glutamate synthase beta subunit-like oxidoreductase/Pyruvate/2-oxoacid:ferredoxin oxidoreductase delta subunit
MTSSDRSSDTVPLRISCSSTTTEANKTGSWRFAQPRYEEKTAPCSDACPAGEDIARVELSVLEKDFEKALGTILMENPFPAVCGRVCFHPCESACNRQAFDAAVGIRHLERFLGDMAIRQNHPGMVDRLPPNGRRVAVVGAGPAGLSAAWFLVRLGFACEVFEKSAEPGGLLRWGIPRYRLPQEILSAEIQRIERSGAVIRCQTTVTEGFIKDLGDRFDATFIGSGHGRSIALKIPGENHAEDGLAFLNRIRREDPPAAKGTTAVIGGGNTAVDVARSVRRLGGEAILVYRRRRRDMPAFSGEVDMALSEGVRLMEMLAPAAIEKKADAYLLSLQGMTLSDMDIGGRPRVIPDGKPVETLRVDRVFYAIGAEADASWSMPQKGDGNALTLSHCTLVDGETPVVFGGDLTNAFKSVTDAIASGKQAALALDTLFRTGLAGIESRLFSCRVGGGPALSMEVFTGGDRRDRSAHVIGYEELNVDYFEPVPRVAVPLSDLEERMTSFEEIEPTLTGPEAVAEAGRCFNCGICNDCDNCRLFCPEIAVIFEASRRIDLDYCKGCGICVVECPRNAMTLEEGTS